MTNDEAQVCMYCGELLPRDVPKLIDHCMVCVNTRHPLYSNVKKFHCYRCYFESTYKNSLVKHVLVHLGAKPYECHLCQAFFTQGSSLKAHVISCHAGDKLHECTFCEFRSSRRSSVKRHEMLKHPGILNLMAPKIP